MKKLLSIIAVLATAFGPSWAGQVYTRGNQFPSTCGSSGLILQANGNCTTSWITAPPPTSLLSLHNTWSGQQDFNAKTTFGSDGVEINTSGQFVSPASGFDFLAANGSTFIFRAQSAANCWKDHVNCYQAQIGPSTTYSILNTQYGAVGLRLIVNYESVQVSPLNYSGMEVPDALFTVLNSTGTNFANNNNILLKIKTENADQVGDLISVQDQGGNVMTVMSPAGGIRFAPKTLSQLGSITPKYIGEIYMCSDCTTTQYCSAHSLTTGDFKGIASLATTCS